MQTLADIKPSSPYALVTDQLQQVKETIARQLATADESVNRLLEHINISSGKMIRPALVLLSGKSCGRIEPVHIRIAAIVEMIHIAALLHDDVLDQAQIRRHRPTVNNLCGNESAVLLGDFLLARVFSMCAEFTQPDISKALAEATVRMCTGELRQSIEKGSWDLTEDKYIDIITNKNGALFSSCCYLGGLTAGADGRELESLARFGLNAGIAFQITDDLLDVVGDGVKTGKTPGSDFSRSKLTLPLIHLFSAIGENEKKALIKKLSRRQEDITALAELLTETGSLDYAASRAKQFSQRAVKSLAGLRQGLARTALLETAKFITQRAF